MAFAPRRRRRRSRWLVFAALLSVLALAVNAGFSSSSSRPAKRLAALAYVDQLRPFVEASTARGAELAEVREKSGQLGRNGIRRKMQRLQRDTRDQLAGVRGVDPPPELEANHSLLVSTMVLRARGTSMVGDALAEALGADPSEPSVDALVKAGGDLVAADHAYRTFVELLVVKGAKSPLLPASKWVADPAEWDRVAVTAFVAALKASTITTPVHDVSVLTLTTDPRPVASEAGSVVLPLVKALRVEIVVANVGNTPEKQVPVVVTLTGPAGEVDTAREFVDLAPGQRRAVTLGGLRPVMGGPSLLRVNIGPVEGEGAAMDNDRTLSLLVRG